MNAVDKSVLYWDSSAVLSVLFQDEHSPVALKYVNHSGAVHLISSLALAETYAVISRVRRERLLADLLIRATVETLETGPWREIRVMPVRSELWGLGARHPLRGADLWHLALVKTLAGELPELRVLTFDRHLLKAAGEEGLAAEYE